MSKNIEMQELTSNGYETLFPKTNVDQVVGIEDTVAKVGDVKCTARTDMGENWMLCNGETIDAGQLTELKSIMTPFQYFDCKTVGNSYGLSNAADGSVLEKYGDNIILIGRYYDQTIQNNRSCVLVSSDGGLNWTKYDGASKGIYSQIYSRPFWSENKWIMFSSCYNSNLGTWVQTYTSSEQLKYSLPNVPSTFGSDPKLKKTDNGFYYGCPNSDENYLNFYYGTDITNLSYASQSDLHANSCKVDTCFHVDDTFYFILKWSRIGRETYQVRSTKDFSSFNNTDKQNVKETLPRAAECFCILQNEKMIYLNFSPENTIQKISIDYLRGNVQVTNISKPNAALYEDDRNGKVYFINGEYIFTIYRGSSTASTKILLYKSFDLENFEVLERPTFNYYLFGTTQEGDSLYCGAAIPSNGFSAKQILLYDEAVILPNITSDKTYNYIKVK